MITFLIILFAIIYFASDISYSVSSNNYLYAKERYKFLFKKLDKEIELNESVEIEEKEEVKDGVSITVTTETKKSVSTSTLSFNEKD